MVGTRKGKGQGVLGETALWRDKVKRKLTAKGARLWTGFQPATNYISDNLKRFAVRPSFFLTRGGNK